uniref:Rho GTPase-activating protein 20 n=1 Tax=Ailuropoda melanoleuca TaxID=9646 RepID=G1M349_AILME
MLCFINQKGPLTEGIFRKSANMKSCRVLKEKLNSGDKVNLDSESVLVVASVLKDFLRNIQGSIFLSDLYDKWLGVIDQGNEEEKIIAAQRLLAQLPRANFVLLRYLFGVLHNIEQHSSSNQMTTYNLSVCIAPSILCPPNSCSLELETTIFGEDITSLLGESSMSCDNSEKAAGTMNNLIAFSEKQTASVDHNSSRSHHGTIQYLGIFSNKILNGSYIYIIY